MKASVEEELALKGSREFVVLNCSLLVVFFSIIALVIAREIGGKLPNVVVMRAIRFATSLGMSCTRVTCRGLLSGDLDSTW
jgi:hypothetical protein